VVVGVGDGLAAALDAGEPALLEEGRVGAVVVGDIQLGARVVDARHPVGGVDEPGHEDAPPVGRRDELAVRVVGVGRRAGDG